MNTLVVSTSESWYNVPKVNQIVHLVRNNYDYKIGNDVQSAIYYTITLYDAKGQEQQHSNKRQLDIEV